MFSLLVSGALRSQGTTHSDLGLQLKSIMPSPFEITPQYDRNDFPYVQAASGTSYGVQLSYSRDFNAHWGARALLDGSLYSTGLRLRLPPEEDPDPNGFGFGHYDFFDSMEGKRISASLGVYYVIDVKWLELKPLVGLNLNTHVWEIMELSHNARLTNPPTRVEVFRVIVGRSRKFNLNPIVGLNASVKLSKLVNLELGMQYIPDQNESLFGTYTALAMSGEYEGLLSNTEERLEFAVGVSFNLPTSSN